MTKRYVFIVIYDVYLKFIFIELHFECKILGSLFSSNINCILAFSYRQLGIVRSLYHNHKDTYLRYVSLTPTLSVVIF